MSRKCKENLTFPAFSAYLIVSKAHLQEFARTREKFTYDSLFMFFFEDAIEVLRRLVVAVGTDLFLDFIAKPYERINQDDCKAKVQKISNYKIRPPNSAT